MKLSSAKQQSPVGRETSPTGMCIEMEKAVEEWKAQGNTYSYEKVCEYLNSIGLYEVPVSTIDKDLNPQFIDCKKETYKYGHSWLKNVFLNKMYNELNA